MKGFMKKILMLGFVSFSFSVYATEVFEDETDIGSEEWQPTLSTVMGQRDFIKRNQFNFGLGLGGGIFEGVGLRGTFFPWNGIGMDLATGTTLFTENYVVGVRSYLSPQTKWSAYLFGKAAYIKSTGLAEAFASAVAKSLVGIFTFGYADTSGISFKRHHTIAVGIGPGIEYMAFNGFTFHFEAGVGMVTRKDLVPGYDKNFLPQANVGLSWQF